MKCKANKDRPIATAAELGKEANLIFLFNKLAHQVCSVKTANTLGFLGDFIDGELFSETWIATSIISTENFYEIRSFKNEKVLVEICESARSECKPIITLEPGRVITMITDTGKYGMFLVKDFTPTSVQIDACHILL